MMKNDQNRFDSELISKLKSLEVKPPSDLWNSLQDSLDAKKRRRLIVIISYASAAVFALLFIIGGIIFQQKTNEEKIVLLNNVEKPAEIQHDKIQPISTERLEILKDSKAKEKETIVTRRITDNDSISEFNRKPVLVNEITKSETIPDFKRKVKAENLTELISKSTEIYAYSTPNIERRQVNWTLTGSAYPVYAFHTSGFSGSSSGLNERGVLTWGSSITIKRSLPRQFEIESGISYGAFGEQIRGLYLVSRSSYDNQISSFEGITTCFGNILLPISSNNLVLDFETLDRLDSVNVYTNAFANVKVDQVLGYVEIPIFLVKKFNAKKIHYQARLGLVTGYLVSNNLNIYGDDIKINSKTQNPDKFHFSAISSVGISIPVSGDVCFTVAPTVKIGLMELSNGNTHPFSAFINFGIEVPLK